MGFWIFLSIDAVISAIALYFFIAGLVDGSVSSFNMGLWMVLLAALGVVLGGSLWLKRIGRPGFGVLLLLLFALPGILYAVFLLVAVFSGSRWN